VKSVRKSDALGPDDDEEETKRAGVQTLANLNDQLTSLLKAVYSCLHAPAQSRAVLFHAAPNTDDVTLGNHSMHMGFHGGGEGLAVDGPGKNVLRAPSADPGTLTPHTGLYTVVNQ
jgi:hypothetical protein